MHIYPHFAVCETYFNMHTCFELGLAAKLNVYFEKKCRLHYNDGIPRVIYKSLYILDETTMHKSTHNQGVEAHTHIFNINRLMLHWDGHFTE